MHRLLDFSEFAEGIGMELHGAHEVYREMIFLSKSYLVYVLLMNYRMRESNQGNILGLIISLLITEEPSVLRKKSSMIF